MTNNLRKLISSLDETKYRRRTGLFKAEGTKCVLDTLPHFKLRHLFATKEWADRHNADADITICRESDLRHMSSLTTPADVIAVYHIPSYEISDISHHNSLIIALDAIQDPGNLGTIIRTADWFGIDTILCGIGTVDAFSPKVIQSTMGAISRVKIIYLDLYEYLRNYSGAIFGTFLDGDNIFTSNNLNQSGIIVMGNEGNGISPQIASTVTNRLHIPSFPQGIQTSESLNVAIATAITIAQFRSTSLKDNKL